MHLRPKHNRNQMRFARDDGIQADPNQTIHWPIFLWRQTDQDVLVRFSLHDTAPHLQFRRPFTNTANGLDRSANARSTDAIRVYSVFSTDDKDAGGIATGNKHAHAHTFSISR